MAAKITKVKKIIQAHKDSTQETTELESRFKREKKYIEKAMYDFKVPKGVRVSGKKWKIPKKRFSSVIKSRGYKAAHKFERLKILKQELNRMRDLSQSIVEERKRQINAKKEWIKINKQRKEANRLKSEIVQVINNSAKIKQMKKKQLRKIEKRNTLNII